VSTAAERIAARESSGRRTAADRLAAKYEHPTGGAKGETFLATQAPKVKPTGVWTPIQAGFNYISRPAYAIGNIVAGNPVEAGKNLLNLVPGTSAIPGLGGKPVFVSDAMRERGWLKDNLAGAIAGGVIDVFTDPTTWLTFGAGAGASQAAKAAAKQGSKEIAEQIARNAAEQAAKGVEGAARLTPQQVADITARTVKAAEGAPNRFSVGVRVPLSRGRTKELFGTERLPAAIERQIDRLPGPLRESGQSFKAFFGESRGMNKGVSEIYNSTRRNAEVWSREFNRSVNVLDHGLGKIDKDLAKVNPEWKSGDAAKAISFHLDDPVGHPLPHPSLEEPAARAAALRDQLHEMEIKGGIEKGEVKDYVPYLVAKARDKEVLKQVFGDNLGVADNPFFVKHKAVPSLEEFVRLGKEKGFEAELSITKLLQRRGRASFKAQTKKAVDDAIAGQWGLKPPLAEMPDVATPKIELEREKARLKYLESHKDTGQVQAVARNSRKRLTAARQRLRSAERTGDPVAVRKARAEVARLADEQRRLQQMPVVAGEPAAVAGGQPIAKFEADVRRTGRAVERGKLRLKKAQKIKSAAAIKEAKAALRRAEAAERRANVALNVARAQYQGTPVAVRAQTKRVLHAQAKLNKVEREAGAIAAANKKLAERPGNFAPTKEAYEEAKQTWQEIASATKYHEGTLLPPAEARSLAAVHKAIAATVKDEDGLAAVGTFMANLGARWKALALLSPGYHIRNQIDDGFRAYVAGARNPATYKDAAEIIRNPILKAGKADAVIEAGGKTYKLGDEGALTRKEILDRAESLGVIDTGFVRSDIGSSADKVRGASKHLPGTGRLAQASNELGAYRENTMRLFLWMELVKRGDDMATAARLTQEALFDYGMTSRFVEVARRFWIPFITFPTKAIPWTLKTAVTRPGTFATLNKAMNASNVASGSPDLSQLPPWLRSGFAVPVPDELRRYIGAPKDQPIIANPERVAAWASLNLLDPRPKQAFSNIIGGMVNPLAVTPLEMASGFDTFFVDKASPTTKQGPLIQWLEKTTGIIPNVDDKTDSYSGRKVPAFPTWIDKLASLLPVYGQANQAIPNTASETPKLGPFKYFTGLPLSPYDRARAAYFAEHYSK
jgi:hypothetical protein